MYFVASVLLMRMNMPLQYRSVFEEGRVGFYGSPLVKWVTRFFEDLIMTIVEGLVCLAFEENSNFAEKLPGLN